MASKNPLALCALVIRTPQNNRKQSDAAWVMCVALFMLCAAMSLHAQLRSSTVTGTVTDSTGAVVPNADVVVTQTATNLTIRQRATVMVFIPSLTSRPATIRLRLRRQVLRSLPRPTFT